MKLKVLSRSVKGDAHKENEDCLLIDIKRKLFAVADGVTIPKGGREASNKLVKYLIENFNGNLRTSILDANNKLVRDRKENKSIGYTTLTAVNIKDNYINVCHVGDSFLFIFRDNKLIKVTEEDRTPVVHFLNKAMGRYIENVKEYKEIIENNDLITLTTDGLVDAIGINGIEEVLKINKDLSYAIDGLIKKGKESNVLYKDDLSVLFIKMGL